VGEALETDHPGPGRSAHLRTVGEQCPLHLKSRLFGDEEVQRAAREGLVDKFPANLFKAGTGLSRAGGSKDKPETHAPSLLSPPRLIVMGSPHAANSRL